MLLSKIKEKRRIAIAGFSVHSKTGNMDIIADRMNPDAHCGFTLGIKLDIKLSKDGCPAEERIGEKKENGAGCIYCRALRRT